MKRVAIPTLFDGARAIAPVLAALGLTLWPGESNAQIAAFGSYGVCYCENEKDRARSPCPEKCSEPPEEKIKVYFGVPQPGGPTTITPLSDFVPKTGGDGGFAAKRNFLEALRRAAEGARMRIEAGRMSTEQLRDQGGLKLDDYKMKIETYNGSIDGYKKFMKDLDVTPVLGAV